MVARLRSGTGCETESMIFNHEVTKEFREGEEGVRPEVIKYKLKRSSPIQEKIIPYSFVRIEPS